MKLSKLLTCFIAILVASSCFSQVKIVQKNKPKSRIVVTTTDVQDSIAASVLQDFVQRATKAQLPIIPADQVKKIKKGDILIGNGLTNASFVSDKLKEDGYLMTTEDGFLRILSGGDNGSVSGVTALLEKYLGVYYWGYKEYSLNKTDELIIPKINIIDNPAFIHRQTHFYGQSDPMYNIFNHYEWVDELFAANLWVHTFRRLVPAAKYGKTHPEFFAEVNGVRNPNLQLCMSSPELLEFITHQLDSIFKANPGKRMISFSQNDSEAGWCQCEKCRSLAEKEEALSAPYINFMNQLADRFPDKEISTLAYQYSMVPPKNLKPRKNVNIFLCNIKCEREVPFSENETGRHFLKALTKWNEISDNLFVWDYGINFHNFISPFPNFHIIAENIRYCRDNDVLRYFLQNSGTIGTDMTELRTWLSSKLMWNPDQDTDELILTFLNGYYGKASAPYLYRYIKLMEGALLAGEKPLLIYDTPATHAYGMLKPTLLKRYKKLFDQAETATAGDSTYLSRIQRSRLPLIFAELEVRRGLPESRSIGVNIEKLLNQFESECKRFNVTTLKEGGGSPKDYVATYRQRYLNRPTNLALNAKVVHKIEADERFVKNQEISLVDGVYGASNCLENWIGWRGTDADFIIDMGEAKDISEINIEFLSQEYSWIYLPLSVNVYISREGKEYKKLDSPKIPKSNTPWTLFVNIPNKLETKCSVRYIRIEVEGKKTFRNGEKCYFFIDEVNVQ